eukprot:scaffold79998_cov20-Tisochrysis_lutea.AAC.3
MVASSCFESYTYGQHRVSVLGHVSPRHCVIALEVHASVQLFSGLELEMASMGNIVSKVQVTNVDLNGI